MLSPAHTKDTIAETRSSHRNILYEFKIQIFIQLINYLTGLSLSVYSNNLEIAFGKITPVFELV